MAVRGKHVHPYLAQSVIFFHLLDLMPLIPGRCQIRLDQQAGHERRVVVGKPLAVEPARRAVVQSSSAPPALPSRRVDTLRGTRAGLRFMVSGRQRDPT